MKRWHVKTLRLPLRVTFFRKLNRAPHPASLRWLLAPQSTSRAIPDPGIFPVAGYRQKNAATLVIISSLAGYRAAGTVKKNLAQSSPTFNFQHPLSEGVPPAPGKRASAVNRNLGTASSMDDDLPFAPTDRERGDRTAPGNYCFRCLRTAEHWSSAYLCLP